MGQLVHRNWLPMSDPTIRTATAADLPSLKRALYLAAVWRGERSGWSQDRVLEHDYFSKYWRGWGRPGDIGVVAEVASAVVGAAYARHFTRDDHGYGFVDEDTPEITIGVEPEQRGRGVGTALLAALATAARRAGVPALSLSTETDNPARHLYARAGYEVIEESTDALVMILRL